MFEYNTYCNNVIYGRVFTLFDSAGNQIDSINGFSTYDNLAFSLTGPLENLAQPKNDDGVQFTVKYTEYNRYSEDVPEHVAASASSEV